MSKSKLMSLVGAASVLSLLVLTGPVSQAHTSASCTASNLTTVSSEVIQGGTKIAFSVTCDGTAEMHDVDATVSADVNAGVDATVDSVVDSAVSSDVEGETVIVLKQRNSVYVGGDADVKTAIHVPTPLTADIGICIEIDGKATTGVANGEASADACANANL